MIKYKSIKFIINQKIMSISNDNILENLFFKIILKNKQLNSEILSIYDLINTQNISNDDKNIINDKIFWFWITNEDHEIDELIKIIRNDEIKNYLLYKMIFELIEDAVDVKDENHLNILLSNTKEELATDIIYYIKHLLDFVKNIIKKEISSKNWLFDNKKDFLDNKELNKVLEQIEILFNNINTQLKSSKEKIKFENKIKKELEMKNKIFNIK